MIVVVDPGAASTNVGDQIISEAVDAELVTPLREQGHEVELVPMHGRLTTAHRAALRHARSVIACGTNLLSDHMRFRRAWHWPADDVDLCRGRLTFLGVGWWQYQRAGIDPVSAAWLRSLAGDVPWAVRDEYSLARLRRARVPAVHTSCPTLWGVEKQTLPSDERRVVVTFTDYSQDPLADRRLVHALAERFDELLFWPQGPGDREYVDGVRGGTGTMLGPRLEDFDAVLDEPGTAYVGLRLHGGIRAMQRGVPTLVLSIDNRAREIARSVGLRAPSRNAARRYREDLRSGEVVRIDVPRDAVDSWRARWGIGS
ncbi:MULTISPECIES: polysaccharide pyruvyl transferase family protein [Cellulosimicrobium]|uniref:Polysaccharide pyruvyl transferase family protein n=1 Tax=Cellulosimicrobium funkei TaxID=264251 RepID=A0A4Y8R6G6_9MICO|nr:MULTISPECIES: polysaccharide pyruvyl transferase family protein [Cellulosimicrobium]TFF16784.1 polysaccharide pyruvyl transferase family protein [Cellulosimicrobium funkei]TGA78386.1 polysaccharide pyruvyl transferase family protein [Cellulosimicrobium terreum]